MPRNNDIIVLRRPEAETESKKGGVWKIAHADFMTAMMAFFLIMWLVNATDEEIKKSIANYFNPMNLMAAPTDVRGISDPTEDARPPASGEESGKSSGRTPMGVDTPGDRGGALGGGNVEQGNRRTMASAGVLEETDNAAFNDPFAQVASAAAAVDPQDPTAVDVPQSTLGTEGTTTQTEEARDPFDPAYWQTVPTRPARTLRPGRADTADVPPPDAVIDSNAARPRGESAAHSPDDAPSPPPAPSAAGDREAGSRAGRERESGDAQALPGPRSQVAEAILAEEAERARRDATNENGPATQADRAKAARNELEEALEGASAEVKVTAGDRVVLVSLTDDNGLSMFPIGSSTPTKEARDLFARVGAVLAEREGRVVVRGHTDARPFVGGTSDNWVLSFERAHATKRVLVESGVAETRFVRVEGLADREPKVPENPFADGNRRIEILYQPAGEAP